MRNSIFKYRLNLELLLEPQAVSVPQGSRTLAARMQNGIPCVWIELDPNAEMERKTFYVVPTGDMVGQVDYDLSTKRHIDTIEHGVFMWHIYEDLIK